MSWPSAISGLQMRMRAPKCTIQKMPPIPTVITEELGWGVAVNFLHLSAIEETVAQSNKMTDLGHYDG